MHAVPADFSIESRFTLPMKGGVDLLEYHALVVRDGRIIDLLPRAEAARAYAPTMVVNRPTHLVLPGLINTSAHLDGTARPWMGAEERERTRDAALALIAVLLRSGTTCCTVRGRHPEEIARSAADQGLRAVVGLPVSAARERAAADDVSRALAVRDEYQGHPLVSTAFSPDSVNALSDAEFARIATLANELDARIAVDLHATAAEIDQSLRLHARRPLDRLNQLGLLTPTLNAVHMCHLSAADIELAQRTGIAVSFCPLADVERERGLPPVAQIGTSLRAGIGSSGTRHPSQDFWIQLKLVAALLPGDDPGRRARQALDMATRGAAAVLGLEAEIGSLERDKWADICCIDLSGPTAEPQGDPVAQLVFAGGRDMVSDVWIAGRQLLSESALTRLDWPQIAAREQRRREAREG